MSFLPTHLPSSSTCLLAADVSSCLCHSPLNQKPQPRSHAWPAASQLPPWALSLQLSISTVPVGASPQLALGVHIRRHCLHPVFPRCCLGEWTHYPRWHTTPSKASILKSSPRTHSFDLPTENSDHKDVYPREKCLLEIWS